MRKKLAAWLVLGLITLAAGFSLSLTNEVTKEPILNQTLQAEAKAKQEVLPAAEIFEAIALQDETGVELFAGTAGGETLGYVGKVTVNGYGGPIDVIAGVNENGIIQGVNVGGASFSETAGLGAKAREAAFTRQFANKVSPVRVVKASDPKTESSVDAITAATITTNAVAGGVNRIARQVSDMLNPQEPEIPVAEGTTYTANQQGFAGPVAVFVTVKDDGTISALKVGDTQFAETQGYGAGALEDDFTAQFIGKSLPLTSGDIDGISGATITTNAVLEAVNQAYEDKNIVVQEGPEGKEYTAQAQGFAGPVAVFITVKDDGTISALKVGDTQFAETQGYGAGALEDDFTAQFIGKSLPVALTDIDGISGATITTNAVLEAVNQAYEAKNIVVQEGPEGKEYTAQAQGFAGPVAVFVTVKDDGTISALKVGDTQFAETQGYGAGALEDDFTAQFIGKSLPVALTDIDGISGATITTNAVLEAINKAYEEHGAAELSEPAAASPEGKEYTAQAQGFAGPVAVFVTVKDDGTISALKVGDTQFAETQGYGAGALEDDFTAQFIGKSLPLASGDIDGISGATITTNAVLEAVNKAYEEHGAAELSEPAAAMPEGKEYTAQAQGFAGPVAVKVTIKEDGTLSSLVVGDTQFAETQDYGAGALEDDFTAQFIGKSLPVALTDIDGISGATITTNAVLEAINKAY
ncbi:MAG: FMN-binding protein, partial [Eubacteriales bacterium]|nr:FMN-binding protein [Eubacteriales bacterium]